MHDRIIHRCPPALAVALLAAGLLLSGCNQSTPGSAGTGAGPDPDTTASGTTTDDATPAVEPAEFVPESPDAKLTFDTIEHDFGRITDTEKYATQFSFTNTGGALLTIENVKAACGCTVPTLSKRDFQPGESGTIDVTFDPKGKANRTDKFITVISNAGEVQLKLTSNIEPMLQYDRMHRIGDLTLGEGYRGEIRLTYRDPNLIVDSVSTNNEHVHGKVVELGVQDSPGDPGRYRGTIELTVDEDIPWGLIYATRMSIEVTARAAPESDPVSYTYTVFIMGNVFGELHAAPGIIGLGRLGAGESFQNSGVISRPDGEPFEVVAVEVLDTTMPGVQTRIEKENDSSYRIVLFGNVGTFNGVIRGQVAITTNVPGEEHLKMRFAGSIKK